MAGRLGRTLGTCDCVRWHAQRRVCWRVLARLAPFTGKFVHLVFFWRDWVLIIRAWLRTLARRRVETPTEKLSWLIILSSIPAGLLGLAFEHELRVLLAKPELAAIFLMVNGLVLFGGEFARRRVLARGSASGERPYPVARLACYGRDRPQRRHASRTRVPPGRQ